MNLSKNGRKYKGLLPKKATPDPTELISGSKNLSTVHRQTSQDPAIKGKRVKGKINFLKLASKVLKNALAGWQGKKNNSTKIIRGRTTMPFSLAERASAKKTKA